MKIQEITGALSAVGFSSPPAWLRSFSSLSNGEAFRATLARLLVEERDPILMDEFTSVVDRTVAKIASAAVAKYVRRGDHKLVVASCHYDVMDWLQPDWVYDTGGYEFTWRHLQPRPPIELEIYRSTPEAWRTFHHHHYLTGNLHKAATCLVALVEGRPAAFASALHRPHGKVKNLVGEHRTVCLPDFQGVGIGNALSEFLASVYIARGMRYRSTTSSPAMIRHRARSSLWRMERPPSMVRPQGKRAGRAGLVTSTSRLTSSFEYVGPQASDDQLSALNLTQGDNRGLG
jgi:energy-coupling factor transporter ATP-binding protein EcfA2